MSDSPTKKTVLVICGGAEAVPGIERVKELGVRVLVSDGMPGAPGFEIADGALLASTYDGPATLAAARAAGPIDAVLSIAADVPRTVACVAAGLGLPGLSQATAELGADKLAMKEVFRERGVPIPWFRAVDSAGELAHALESHPRLILKPVDSRGSRGVLQLTRGMDLERALATSLADSPSGRVIVEEFVDGPQISSESIVQNGRVHTLGFSDRNYEHLATYAPHVIENGGCQPSVHLDTMLEPCNTVLEQAAAAIGLDTGVLKGDLVLGPEGPVVIEVAPRLSGGWFCTDQIPYSTGVDIVQLATRLALGETLGKNELSPRSWKPIAVRYAFPAPGRVLAVRGEDELRKHSWLQRLTLFVRPGDLLEAPTNHTKRAAMALATGATREEATGHAIEAVERLVFETTPGLSERKTA